METIDHLRNDLINRILTISNKDYLKALSKLIENGAVEKGKIKITKEQELMLKMSEEDIKNGRVVPHSEVDKSDLEWLKTL